MPTSLIANWVRELQRFAPTLSAHVHHGPQRLSGDAFARTAVERDVVITTYALVPRDRETLAARQAVSASGHRTWNVRRNLSHASRSSSPKPSANSIQLMKVMTTGTSPEVSRSRVAAAGC